jgi:tetratricopeptide (TPR) repeat protein
MIVAFQGIAQNNGNLQQIFKQSYTLETSGEYSDAIAKLKAIYDEDSYEINLRLGWLTYLSGNFTESLPYYRKCVQLRPLSIEARLGIVLPLSSIGNWTEVELHYRQILENDPANSLVNYRMGLLHYGREDYQGAFQYFELVVNHYPFDYDGAIMLAWTNFKLGKYREAKVLFNKVLLMQPDDESALEGLGLIK